MYEEIGELAPADASGLFGPTYANKKRATDGALYSIPADAAATLCSNFMASHATHSTRRCLGYRPMKDGEAQPFEWLTYEEVKTKVELLAQALVEVLKLSPGDKVGIFSQNVPEYQMVIIACSLAGVTFVPLYDTLGETAIEYVCNHAELKVVFCHENKIAMLRTALPKAKTVQTVVVWGLNKSQGGITLPSLETAHGIAAFEDTLAQVTESKPVACASKRGDTAVIMYTSGTTGTPKGVLITHEAIVATSRAMFQSLSDFKSTIQLEETDVFLSYLPLAHIFGVIIECAFLACGGSIGYFQGDIKKISDDIGELKPTVFCGVPRVFERLYNGIMAKVKASGFIKNTLFQWGFSHKLKYLKQGMPSHKASPFFDKLVFGKVKARLGGRVKVIVSGGAPLSPDLEDFLKVTMCCPVIQGYGLTETCGASFSCVPDNYRCKGTVGLPCSGMSFRLEKVEGRDEWDPTVDPPTGEICLKGVGLFSGYYKDQAKTDEAMTGDGYFRTGDVGKITEEGYLKIIDRKKNMIKLSQGEYVALEYVENKLKMCPYVDQLWVFGNSMESYLVAVVIPTEDEVTQWATQNGKAGSFAELCADPGLTKTVEAEVRKEGKKCGLKGFEIPAKVYVCSEAFTPENGLLTPSMKLQRPKLQKKYQPKIDGMYKSLKSSKK